MLKTVLREIKSSLGRYLAIMAIIALGTGFFSGLVVTKPAMIDTIGSYITDTSFYDWRVVSTLGYTQKQVDALAELEYVEAAEGSVAVDFLTHAADGSELVFKAHSITGRTNLLQLNHGRMPERADECVGDWGYYTAADIGSTVRISPNNSEDTLDSFAYDEYTIVGIATTPNYINFERGNTSLGSGSVAAYVYIPLEGFDTDYFTEVYITLNEKAEIYTDAYAGLTAAYEEGVTAAAEENAHVRYEDIVSEAVAELADGQREYDDGYQEYQDGLKEYSEEKADAEQELADALLELEDGEKEIKDGWGDYYDGVNKLPEERAKAEKELADALIELQDGEKEYADGLAELQDGEDEYAEGLEKLQDGEAEYEDGLEQYEDGMAEYYSGKAELDEAFEQLDAAKAELDAGKAELDAGKAELDAGKAELDAGKAELDGARAELDSAQSELDGQLEYIAGSINQATGSSLSGSDVMAGLEAGDPMISAAVGGSASALLGAQTQIDAGWAQYEAGLAEYESGLAEYEAGLAEYESGLAEYEAGRAEYEAGLDEAYAGQQELREGRQELYEAEVQLYDARQELDDGWEELNDARKELDDGWAEIKDARKELDDGWAEIKDARIELDDGWREYEDGKLEMEEEFAKAERELNDAYYELKDAEKELADGWVEYEDGRAEADKEFADALRELEDAELELKDAQQELLDARKEIDDIEQPEVFVLGRETNVGYACFENDSQIVAGIAKVFPIFFILVAALVCITTMTRMVDEQRTEIGTYKALGFSSWQIMSKYLLYSGSASLIGCVGGFFLGTWLFPFIIWKAYSMMYGITEINYYFDLSMGVISTVSYLAVSGFATWYACRRELRDVPAELIRPRSPKAGKRIFLERLPFLWKRVSFMYKVSIRNVLRYKQRMFMMALGIGGCTALLLTGYGIKDSIKDIVKYQYDEISLYEYAVNFTEAQDKNSIEQLKADCGDSIEHIELVYEGNVDFDFGGKVKSISLVAPYEGELEGIIDLHDGASPISYPGAGEAVICRNIARNFGIEVGDSFTVRDSDMNSLSLTVTGIFDQYVYNYVYISPESFMEQWGYVPEMKTAYANPVTGVEVHEAAALLLEQEDIAAVSVTQDMEERIGSMMSSLDYIVGLVIACSGALAFIVLYNLTNINITERIREIATIKVLGFYPGETAGYVFRENMALTVLGIAVGLPMGVWLINYVIDQIVIDNMYFQCRIEPISYVWSAAFTVIFACIVNIVMYFKLERINMTEALKSIE